MSFSQDPNLEVTEAEKQSLSKIIRGHKFQTVSTTLSSLYAPEDLPSLQQPDPLAKKTGNPPKSTTPQPKASEQPGTMKKKPSQPPSSSVPHNSSTPTHASKSGGCACQRPPALSIDQQTWELNKAWKSMVPTTGLPMLLIEAKNTVPIELINSAFESITSSQFQQKDFVAMDTAAFWMIRGMILSCVYNKNKADARLMDSLKSLIQKSTSVIDRYDSASRTMESSARTSQVTINQCVSDIKAAVSDVQGLAKPPSKVQVSQAGTSAMQRKMQRGPITSPQTFSYNLRGETIHVEVRSGVPNFRISHVSSSDKPHLRHILQQFKTLPISTLESLYGMKLDYVVDAMKSDPQLAGMTGLEIIDTVTSNLPSTLF
uniref:Uncharacterized protein n=1 Tax=Coleopteran rhabdo-related virus OKIAV28 TaxID=2746288 RepID=A0A7D7J1F1_9RHAB|nr:hypothetical protein [Coleopteran rhabdo-related virus OKIAV28]